MLKYISEDMFVNTGGFSSLFICSWLRDTDNSIERRFVGYCFAVHYILHNRLFDTDFKLNGLYARLRRCFR